MLRMRRITQILSAAALAAFVGAQAAQAEITLSLTQVPWGTDPLDTYTTALENNGWSAWILTAHATGSSASVAALDMRTPISTPTETTSNSTAYNWGIFALEGGAFAQAWEWRIPTPQPTIPSNRQYTQSNQGVLPIGESMYLADSFFSSQWSLASGVDPFEDNNLVSLPDSPDGHPVEDELWSPRLGVDYGIGQQMRFAGIVTSQDQRADQEVAFLILKGVNLVPMDANNELALYQLSGSVVDNKNVPFIFAVGLGEIPEPASLGVLALGGLALLARRRKA